MNNALKFLASKGITKMTCYTDAQKTYYVDDIAELLEEYKNRKEPKEIVPPTYEFTIINDEWYLLGNDFSTENFGSCIDTNNNVISIQHSDIIKCKSRKIIASSLGHDATPMLDKNRIYLFLAARKNISDISTMTIAVSDSKNTMVTYTNNGNRYVLINSISYK